MGNIKGGKKTIRDFTPVTSMKHFCEKIEINNEKNAFMWYDNQRELHSVSYSELALTIKKEAAAFSKIGFSGKRIAIIGETSYLWVSTYAAAIASGNVVIPLDKELKIEELEGFLEFAEADALVYSASFNQKFESTVQNHPTVSKFIPMDVSDCSYADNEKVISLDEFMKLGEEEIENGYTFPEPTDLDRMSVMLFTSGTTGTSKCVMLSEKNVISAVNAACNCVEFFPDDTIVSTLPLHHTYELCCLIAGLNYGMQVGINDSLKRTLKNFEAFQPTGLVLVPLFVNTMYKKIWETAKKTGKEKALKTALKVSAASRKVGIDLRGVLFKDVIKAFGGRLNKIVSGGAPLNPEIAQVFDDFGVRISEGYGITECSPLISVNPYFAPKRGSVGPAVDCCTVKIDEEQQNDKGFNEGEILVKGDNVMLGYYKNPEETAKVFTEDGYFRTGDVGYMDEDGYIFITGRKKSVIVLENGKNVFPEEVEEYLANIPCIAESVVVGRKKDDSDTIVLTAIVYPAYSEFPAGTDSATISSTIKDEIAKMNRTIVSYKQIRAIEIRSTEFEKTTSKKIKRHLVS